MLVGIAIEIPFAIGEAVLGVEAYLIRSHPPLLSNIQRPFQGLENSANGGLPAPPQPHRTLVTIK